jgi:hypothetical protein
MGNSGFTRREFLRGGGLAFGAGLAVALGAGCGGFSGTQGGGR